MPVGSRVAKRHRPGGSHTARTVKIGTGSSVTLELAPEIADIDIHDVRSGVVLVAPYRAEDLLA